MQKCQRRTPDPNANIPGELYCNLSLDFKKVWTGLSSYQRVQILCSKNKLKNHNLTAKMAPVEQELQNVQANLVTFNLQAYASRTTTFGELQANQAHQAAIKAYVSNLNKTQKTPANNVHPGSVLGLLGSSTQSGITSLTVIINNRPAGTTQVQSVTLNHFQFHPCSEIYDNIPSVDINMTIQDPDYENTVTYWVSKREFSRITQSLIDSGANGGLAGYKDMLLILPNGEFVNVKGIDDHILNRIKLGTFASKVKTN